MGEMMNTTLLIIAGVALLVLFVVVQWRAARNPVVPLRRLPTEQQRELVRLYRQLEKAAAEGNDRDVYYYDGLMMGILAIYLPELGFLQARHTLNKWQGEL
jgi:hypothetical protein